jgi:hypothetical protein
MVATGDSPCLRSAAQINVLPPAAADAREVCMKGFVTYR